MLDINQIRNIIQHRYPFLMVDRVLEFEKGERGIGIKNITINEPFFEGHFPERPIMPGVLIIECLAQMSAIIADTEKPDKNDHYLVSINNARFLKPVTPGDQLILEVEIVQKIKSLIKVRARAKVKEEIVVKAELGLTLIKKD